MPEREVMSRTQVRNPLVTKLEGDLSAAEVSLQDLLMRYNEKDRRVQEKKEHIAVLKNELAAAEKEEIIGSETTGLNPLRRGREQDLVTALAGLTSWEPSPGDIADTEYEALDRLDRLLRVPWHAQAHALRLEDNTFHLAVLSANKGRLAVREWLAAPLATVRDNLADFLDAQRIVSPEGGAARPLPVPQLLAALGLSSAHDTRGLLRTAYLGVRPMPRLMQAALGRLHSPNNRNNLEVAHALAALVKLVRTHRTGEAKNMEVLDKLNRRPAYLAGRLLAVLEAAQRRSATGRLSTTIADRFYGGAATAPAATLGWLVTRAHPAYFAKLRRDGRGRDLERLMEEILCIAEAGGGFRQTHTLEDQADFHLGFYCQRAALQAGPRPSTTS
jgi:CRISPR-associated protein Cas8c/Csd1 subtype I-C